MLINQRFKIRKDIGKWLVYFEDDGPVEMSEMSAVITSLIGEIKSKDELIKTVINKYPKCNPTEEVDKVVNALQKMNLLS